MILIKYLDVYGSYYDEEGHMYEELLHRNHAVPFYICSSEILTITPYFGTNGRLYRNVSVLKDRYGNTYKVVGNYKELIALKENKPVKGTIGYGTTTNKI